MNLLTILNNQNSEVLVVPKNQTVSVTVGQSYHSTHVQVLQEEVILISVFLQNCDRAIIPLECKVTMNSKEENLINSISEGENLICLTHGLIFTIKG